MQLLQYHELNTTTTMLPPPPCLGPSNIDCRQNLENIVNNSWESSGKPGLEFSLFQCSFSPRPAQIPTPGSQYFNGLQGRGGGGLWSPATPGFSYVEYWVIIRVVWGGGMFSWLVDHNSHWSYVGVSVNHCMAWQCMAGWILFKLPLCSNNSFIQWITNIECWVD